MKCLFYTLLLSAVSSVTLAAPILTLPKTTSVGGRDIYTVTVNPNGSVYGGLNIRATTTSAFNSPSNSPTTPGSENTRPLNTLGDADITSFGAGFTPQSFNVDMTILGGDISTYTGGLAQLTGPAGFSGQVTLEFVSPEGEFLTELFQTLNFGAPPTAALAGVVAGGDLSAALQAAFQNRDPGGNSFSVANAVTLSNSAGAFGDLGSITPLATDGQPGDGVNFSLTGGAGGVYGLTVTAPNGFETIAPNTLASGSLLFTSANGDPNTFSVGFSVAVPEPSTFALTGLALVGLVGFARRRNK